MDKTAYTWDPLNTVTGGSYSRVVAAGSNSDHRAFLFSDEMGCLDAPDLIPAGSTVNLKDTDCICPMLALREK